jgi:hypothetical protein
MQGERAVIPCLLVAPAMPAYMQSAVPVLAGERWF